MIIRNSKVARFISVFFLTLFISNTVVPTVSFALTNGPHQPDFTEYEEPGSTDMVNLLTGDFTYSIPALEVPGPEGAFSLPLSYHSGIGLEQEASWVGLGFSMNAGAINRNVVGYPDDANGENFDIYKADPNVQRGWRSSLGPFGNIGWNSNTGHHGTISLLDIVSVSYNHGTEKDVSVIGVHANRNGVHVEPAEAMNAIGTIASLGVGSAASGTQVAAKAFQETAKQIAIQSAISTALAVGVSAFGNNGSGVNSLGYFPVQYKKSGFNYRYWIDATKSEWMYGTLNLGKMPILSDASHSKDDVYEFDNPRIKNDDGIFVPAPTYTDVNQNGIGPSSDMHMPWDGESYYDQNFLGPTSIAKDNFSVLGPGISGSIEPYRLDVGSLAFPRNAVEHHEKIALNKFTDYKVQFKYPGSFSNEYNHHAGKPSVDAIPDANSPLFGVDVSFEQFPNNANDKILLNLSDVTLTEQRREPDRNGLKSDRLILGKNIEWFTNKEILTEPDKVIQSGFIDFLTAAERQAFRATLPQDGIGGYSITREDGMTYHYAIPVYDRKLYTKIVQADNTSKYSEVKRDAPFAHTWLLTAITGADYVDQDNDRKGVLDEGDTGYWVKFEYGKFSDSYQYRLPYGKDEYTLDASKTTKSFTQGERENYYLNFIKTRSHTAMFIKGLRKDGRGFYSYNGNVLERAPASSLYLDEIVLLSNEMFKSLNNGETLLQLPLEAAKNLISAGANDPYSGDQFEQVLDIYDIDDSSIGGNKNLYAEMMAKAIRRIKFNYSNSLCDKTPNAFDFAKQAPNVGHTSKFRGKLTLESLSFYGQKNTKLAPDYIFEYGNNPAYNKNNWDGWGMYHPNGEAANHTASANKTGGSEWSLSSILTPLGSKISVEYERDSYSSVSGIDAKQKITGLTLDVSTRKVTFDTEGAGGIDLRNYLTEGQSIKFFSTGAKQECICWDFSDVWTCEYDYNIPQDQTISNITANTFVLSNIPGFVNEYNDGFNGRKACHLKSLNDSHILLESVPIAGGNVRVKVLTVTDENNNSYKTKYLYSQDETEAGLTSGVVAQEPDYVSRYDYQRGDAFDLPFTPVLYAKATVLSGALSNDNDFIVKRVFEFKTPNSNSVTTQQEEVFRNGLINKPWNIYSYTEGMNQVDFQVDVRTSEIGQPLSITSYDKRGTLTSKSVFQYASEVEGTNQGLFTEGSILAEKLRLQTNPREDQLIAWWHRVFRTTKRYHPSVLKSVVTINNNLVTASENKKWDYFTGAVKEQETRDAYGNTFLSVNTPAYEKYPSMASKVLDPSNKNMLSQNASNIIFKIKDGSPAVMAEAIQTWRSNWPTYRYFDEASSMYKDQSGAPVWRTHQLFEWNSPFSNPDGTLKDFVAFNWASEVQDPYWQKGHEITRFDHFSMPLESRDLNGNYSSVKMGHVSKLAIASAVNARYGEFAFSGAEDKTQVGTAYHFSGEVRDADRQDATYHHTGNFAIKLANGQKGFTYKAKIGPNNDLNTEVESGRTYVANVWIHKSDLGVTGGKLYAEAGGSTIKTIDLTTPAKQAGDWLLMSLLFEVPTTYNGSVLTVGCVNTGSGNVYFDDFAFRPLDAQLVGYVYNTETNDVTYTLDNNNLYTRFEYDEAGRLRKTFREVFDQTRAERIVSHTQYNFARMNVSQWSETGNTRCVTLADGSNSGQQEKEQKDINPSSSTYNQLRWVANGFNAVECAPCTGYDKKFINGMCETGTRQNIASYQSGDSWICEFKYNFSDDTSTTILQEVNTEPCAL